MASTTGAYDEFVFTTGDELWNRIHQAQRRFAALLSVTSAKTPIRGSDWNAGQVAGHLLNIVRRYTGGALVDGTGLSEEGAGVAELNARELADLRPMTVAEALDQVWQELADIEKMFPRDMDLHEQFSFHGGVKIDAAAALGNLIGEFLVHGRDVALAQGKTWKIGSRNAALTLNVGVQAAAAYVRPDAPGNLKIELRTPETNAWMLDLAGGTLTSRRSIKREPADVRIYGRAEALLLNQFGRMNLASATLHGVTVIGGRKPWRLARLPRTFIAP